MELFERVVSFVRRVGGGDLYGVDFLVEIVLNVGLLVGLFDNRLDLFARLLQFLLEAHSVGL